MIFIVVIAHLRYSVIIRDILLFRVVLLLLMMTVTVPYSCSAIDHYCTVDMIIIVLWSMTVLTDDESGIHRDLSIVPGWYCVVVYSVWPR